MDEGEVSGVNDGQERRGRLSTELMDETKVWCLVLVDIDGRGPIRRIVSETRRVRSVDWQLL